MAAGFALAFTTAGLALAFTTAGLALALHSCRTGAGFRASQAMTSQDSNPMTPGGFKQPIWIRVTHIPSQRYDT